jgi:hypothetical protein
MSGRLVHTGFGCFPNPVASAATARKGAKPYGWSRPEAEWRLAGQGVVESGHGLGLDTANPDRPVPIVQVRPKCAKS